MKRHLALIILNLMIGYGIVSAAQQPPRPAAPSAPSTQPAPQAKPAVPRPAVVVDPEAGGQPINIRLDVSLVDQSGPGPVQPKTVMVMLVDRAMGKTRSVFEDRTINVDARPEIRDGRIRVNLTVQSAPVRVVDVRGLPVMPGTPEASKVDRTLDWRNSFSLLLENGKPMLALESSDPAKNRKLSLEVKATIVK